MPGTGLLHMALECAGQPELLRALRGSLCSCLPYARRPDCASMVVSMAEITLTTMAASMRLCLQHDGHFGGTEVFQCFS